MGATGFFRQSQYAQIHDKSKRGGSFWSLQSTGLITTSSDGSRLNRNNLFEGWRFGVFLSCVTSLLLFIINLSIAIYAARKYPIEGIYGLGTIFQGPCRKTKLVDSMLHIGINAISTGLLAASN